MGRNPEEEAGRQERNIWLTVAVFASLAIILSMTIWFAVTKPFFEIYETSDSLVVIWGTSFNKSGYSLNSNDNSELVYSSETGPFLLKNNQIFEKDGDGWKKPADDRKLRKVEKLLIEGRFYLERYNRDRTATAK